MLVIQVFVYLQILDYLTTLVGFKLGASEVSPFIVKLIHATSPAIGVGISKLMGVVIGGICVAIQRARLINLISYWYAGLVVWNLCVILAVGTRLMH
jgi:hypothetical protein